MKKATLCAIIGAGIEIAWIVLGQLLQVMQQRIIEGGGEDVHEKMQATLTYFQMLNWASVVGWALLMFFFITLYKKQ